MKKTIKLMFLGILILLGMLSVPRAPAFAQGPWQYQMSLRVETTGDSMYMPSAVAFDPDAERYYVVDTGRSRLVSFDREGKVLKAFTAEGRLKSPFDMVRLDKGRLWVVEKGRNSVTLIDIPGREVKPFILKDGNRQVFPDRIAYSGGKLFVLDRSSGQILRLNANMDVEQRFGCKDCLEGMIDFVIADGMVQGIEPRGKKIYRFRQDGTLADTITLGDEIDFPVSLDIGPSGSFYVLDRHQNKVFAYSEDGRYRYSFLGSGQAPGKVYFARQIRFDPWGRLCVVDEGNGRVEVYNR